MLLLLCFAACGSAVFAAAPAVGTLKVKEGDVTIWSADAPAHKMQVGESVHEGDVLETAKDAEAHLQMLDLAYIAMRANTRIKITGYRAEGDEQDRSALEIFKGAMRAITGWVGHYNRNRYGITTPTATLGIRGTDHEISVRERDDDTAQAGTYDHVIKGGVVMKTPSGEVNVDPDQAGFAGGSDSGGPPKLLPRIPGVFPKGKNEGLMEGMHDVIQKQMPDARAKKLAERKAGVTKPEITNDKSDASSSATAGSREAPSKSTETGDAASGAGDSTKPAATTEKASTSTKDDSAKTSDASNSSDKSNTADEKRSALKNKIRKEKKP